MPANTAPIYSKLGDVQWIDSITAANTNAGINSGTSYLGFTADATNGGFAREARLKAAPGNNTAATVWRIWINNGSTTATKSNSFLFAEIGIPATTASNSAPQPDFVCPLNLALPAGYRIYFTLGTAPGGSGEFYGCVVGGKY